MNHFVPDFEFDMDEDKYPLIPPSSGFTRPKKHTLPDDDTMELLWQDGQVVMQNHRPLRKPPPTRFIDGAIPAGPSMEREIRPLRQEVEHYHDQQLFMQEDELTSWLYHSIVDDPPLNQNFCADLIYPSPTVNNSNQNNIRTMQTPVRTSQVTELRQPTRSVAAPRPPIPPARRPEQMQMKIQNFAQFSKHNAIVEPGPSSSKNGARELTVVDSCDTPAVVAVSRVSEIARSSAEPTEGYGGRGSMSTAAVAAPSTTSADRGTGGREAMTCEMTMTSPGGSSESAEQANRLPAKDRKRKGREREDSECQSEDLDFETAEAKEKFLGSTSTKRCRAAEVHSLSERKRRDRINEKMRALQELIPRCNKSDKASMLDEAIEYLKSLQLQVQMMSMGCGMVPMMFPGIQQYMLPMGMGIGMGMGMEKGMNRPVMPFPNMFAGSALPAATAAAHLGPRFSMPPFHMPHVPAPDPARTHGANQSDIMLTSLGAPDLNQSRIPNFFTDTYQHYLGPHQMQLPLMQNQAMNQPNAS